MRVLVCGSRTFSDPTPIEMALEGMYSLLLDHYEGMVPDLSLTVISGGADGADQFAEDWAIGAQHRKPLVLSEVYPADWKRYGKRAGYVRNQQMLDVGKPNFTLAFVDKPLTDSRGTAMMVDLARKAGVPTWVTEVIR